MRHLYRMKTIPIEVVGKDFSCLNSVDPAVDVQLTPGQRGGDARMGLQVLDLHQDVLRNRQALEVIGLEVRVGPLAPGQRTGSCRC